MLESVSDFARQVRRMGEGAANRTFVRLYLAIVLVYALLVFTLIYYPGPEEGGDGTCRAQVCDWFGEPLVVATWIAAILAQFLPRRVRRKYFPEVFLVLPIVLVSAGLTLNRSLSGSGVYGMQPLFVVLMLFPLLAQIVVGAVETGRRWRRLLLGSRRQRRQ